MCIRYLRSLRSLAFWCRFVFYVLDAWRRTTYGFICAMAVHIAFRFTADRWPAPRVLPTLAVLGDVNDLFVELIELNKFMKFVWWFLLVLVLVSSFPWATLPSSNCQTFMMICFYLHSHIAPDAFFVNCEKQQKWPKACKIVWLAGEKRTTFSGYRMKRTSRILVPSWRSISGFRLVFYLWSEIE